jgi:glutathione S-transferase
MLTLFHAPRSRSSRFIWLLEELGAPYQIQKVDIRRPTGGSRDPKNPHPDGKVPALVHDGVLVTESAAIVLYLTDLFPEKQLGPRVGDAKRGEYLTWLAYYAGVMEPVIVSRSRRETDSDPDKKKAADELDQRLTRALEAGPWVLGEDFSGADILVASIGQFSRELLPAGRLFDDYLARCAQRPALQRALAKDG